MQISVFFLDYNAAFLKLASYCVKEDDQKTFFDRGGVETYLLTKNLSIVDDGSTVWDKTQAFRSVENVRSNLIFLKNNLVTLNKKNDMYI